MLIKWILVLPFLLVLGCSTIPENPNSMPGVPSAGLPQPSISRGLPKSKPTVSTPRHQPPPIEKQFVTLEHGDFQIVYDPSLRSARYVKYFGLAERLRGARARRKNKFIADPLLIKKGLPYVTPVEYAHTSYDRGHLAPAGDFTYSQAANDATFVMSNMSPQRSNLNRKAWKQLESKVRNWICGEERLIVITGPIFAEHPETLKSGLPIPEQFFKIVIDDTPPKKVIAFIYNQTDSKVMLSERVAALSDIESKTQLHFDDQLPEELRSSLRTPAGLEDWKEGDCR